MFKQTLFASVLVLIVSGVIYASDSSGMRQIRQYDNPATRAFMIDQTPIVTGQVVESVMGYPVQERNLFLRQNSELAPSIKDCLCDSCRRIDDFGYCPVLCCAVGIWTYTGSSCVVATCGVASCLALRSME